MPSLESIRDGWDNAAKRNAMGNIVTSQVDWNPDEFYATGQAEIAACLAHLDEHQLRSDRRIQALDFGCGLGRLTVPLRDHYDRVTGVDIAPDMIRQAARRPGIAYVCAESLTFIPAGSVDLIYSNITLQHLPQTIQCDYIREFVRVLHGDGLAVFEIPDGPEFRHEEAHLSMYAICRADVERVVGEAGGVVVDVEVPWDDADCAWVQYRYAARRL